MVEETQELKDATYDENGNTVIDGVKYKRLERSKNASLFATSKDDKHFYWDKSVPYLYFRYEPILWRVLSTEDDEVFLLSEYCLDYQSYDVNTRGLRGPAKKDITWYNSSIRKWLNEDFLKTAFTKDEQKVINTSTVTNYSNIKLHVKQQETTLDKVFLISLDDLVNEDYDLMKIMYWDDNGKPAVKTKNGYTSATDYAYSLGVEQVMVGETPSAYYWLRSKDTHLAKYTGYQQFKYVWQVGWDITTPYGGNGVRPAIKISTAAIK